MELLFFGRAGEGLDGGGTALDDGGDFVEVTGTDFLLVRNEGVAVFAGSEFRFLNHVHVVLHAFAASVGVGELEGVESWEHRSKAMPGMTHTEICPFEIHSTHSLPTAGEYGAGHRDTRR